MRLNMFACQRVEKLSSLTFLLTVALAKSFSVQYSCSPNSTNEDHVAPIDFQSLSPETKKAFIDSIDTIVSDCDGVVWNPLGVIKEANQAVEKLMARGKRLYFVTNNSLKTKATLASEFQRLGFVGVTEDCVLCPAGLAAAYLRDHLPAGKSVYVVGPPSVHEELRKVNIECFGVGKDEEGGDEAFANISTIEFDLRDNVGAVLVGYDIHFSLVKIIKAATYLKNKDCLFVATNMDPTFPSGRPFVMPGAGSVVASIKTASGREPFVVGKPSTYISEMLKTKFDPKRTLFVGDRLESDILIGRKCNFKTLLVLTGIHDLEDVARYSKSKDAEERSCVPDYYTSAFSDLVVE